MTGEQLGLILRRLFQDRTADTLLNGDTLPFSMNDLLMLIEEIEKPVKFTIIQLSDALNIIEGYDQRPETGMQKAYEFLRELERTRHENLRS
jgi:hypothetical protein